MNTGEELRPVRPRLSVMILPQVPRIAPPGGATDHTLDLKGSPLSDLWTEAYEASRLLTIESFSLSLPSILTVAPAKCRQHNYLESLVGIVRQTFTYGNLVTTFTSSK